VNIEAIPKNQLFAGLGEADLDALQAIARVREDQAARAAAETPGQWHPRMERL